MVVRFDYKEDNYYLRQVFSKFPQKLLQHVWLYSKRVFYRCDFLQEQKNLVLPIEKTIRLI